MQSPPRPDAPRDQGETCSLLTPSETGDSFGDMSSTLSGGGFPGGFPSMPGFGGGAPPESDLLDRLEELTERHRAGTISDAQYAAEKNRLLTEG